MSISSNLMRLALAIVVLSSCQFASPTPYIPRVPEVISTVKAKMLGGDGVVVTNPRTGYIYVAGSRHINILKGTESIGEVETGGIQVKSMAVDEADDLVYVVNEYSDNVTVLRGTERIGIVPTVGRSPWSVAVEPKSHLAYIVSGYRDRPLTGDSVGSDILVLRGNQVVSNLRVSGRIVLTQVVADPIGGYIYAAGAADDVIVFKGLQEVARYKVPPSFAKITVDSRSGTVYVLSDAIIYRFKEGKMVDSVKIKDNEVDMMQVHSTTGDVYVPHWGHEPKIGSMLILRDMNTISDLKVGERPHALTIDPLTGNVYVASFQDNTVTVINGFQVLATIKVGWYPYNIGVNPANGWVYVSNINDGTVSILGYPPSQSSTPALAGATPTIFRTPTSAAYP